jgi:hypothetical protein
MAAMDVESGAHFSVLAADSGSAAKVGIFRQIVTCLKFAKCKIC